MNLNELALAAGGAMFPFGIGMPAATKGFIEPEKWLMLWDVSSGLPNVIYAIVNLSRFLKMMGKGKKHPARKPSSGRDEPAA